MTNFEFKVYIIHNYDILNRFLAICYYYIECKNKTAMVLSLAIHMGILLMPSNERYLGN